tara:strand:+ start:660 stop:890 length:231 start_codon:yes stop_codon:yes gene_type:complete
VDIFINVIIFSIGFFFGLKVKGALFSRLDWNILKWDSDIFAYRVAPKGSKIKKDDKIFMALKIPDSSFSKDGLKHD